MHHEMVTAIKSLVIPYSLERVIDNVNWKSMPMHVKYVWKINLSFNKNV